MLISPAWIGKISWLESSITTALTREAIQTAPEYNDSLMVTREYEQGLHIHYGQPDYWTRER